MIGVAILTLNIIYRAMRFRTSLGLLYKNGGFAIRIRKTNDTTAHNMIFFEIGCFFFLTAFVVIII